MPPSLRRGRRDEPGVTVRRLAVQTLARIEADDAYANLALPAVLAGAGLDRRDRAAVTDLVYGTLRMRRACDFAVDRFLVSDPPPAARWALRVGAYQLVVTGTPAHAAVATTVAATPSRYRGLVNAVLRKVSTNPPRWPDEATRLSYPDWILERLVADLGERDALGALASMDEPTLPVARADGYVQDLASQWVAEEVGPGPGMVAAELCAAPGGKSTALAAAGAAVVAGDLRPRRAQLVAENVARTAPPAPVWPLVADGRHPPLRPGRFDRVLVDAPCSGLGVLHRRADARWRVDADAPDRLAELQRLLLAAAADLVAPGGWLVYSVCTMTRAETVEVAEHFSSAHPGFESVAPGTRWRPWGSGGLLLPQDAGTDGMAVFRWRVPSGR